MWRFNLNSCASRSPRSVRTRHIYTQFPLIFNRGLPSYVHGVWFLHAGSWAGKKEKYDNRIQFFKDHIELRKTNPQYYDGVDINFTNLLESWSAPNPRDHFYMKVFGKTYAEKMAESELEKSEKVTIN